MGEQPARIPCTSENNSDHDASGWALVASAPVAMAITEGETHILRCANAAFLQLLGRGAGDVIGHPLTNVLHSTDLIDTTMTLDQVYRTGSAEVIPEWEHTSPSGERALWTIAVWPIHDGAEQPKRLVMQVNTVATPTQTVLNITERLLLSALQAQEHDEEAQRHAALMEHHALHDTLTGLPNRTLLADRTTQAMRAASRAGHRVALIFMDLNRFKALNDRFGHHIGDAVLEQVGIRISGVLREADTIARLGGDEFVILLADVTDTADAASAAQRILDSLIPPFVIDGIHHSIGASSGVAIYPDDASDFPTLLRRADAAMYAAKREQPYSFNEQQYGFK